MAAISPFNFLAVLDGKAQAPELISPEQTIPAFEDALASMMGSDAENANGGENPDVPTAAPTLGLPAGIRLTLDPPLNGVPSGAETDAELADFGLIPADSRVDAAVGAEPIDDEELLVNPQGCFVTLPWLPPSDRAPEPLTTSTLTTSTPSVDLAVAKRAPELSAHAALERAAARAEAGAHGDLPRRHGTLRFPPPPAEAIAQVMREVAPVKSDASKQLEEAAPTREKTLGEAPQARRAQGEHAAVEPRSLPRVLEPGFIVAPSFVEGGRIEWTIATPAAPANDTHRSMSYAVAAAEHEQRTVRNEPRASKRERNAPVSSDPASREPIDRSAPSREIVPTTEVAKVTDSVNTATVPEAPAFLGHASLARSDAAVEPRAVTNVAHTDFRNEASRERRQDDAEVTVSQMTLGHRVEARTVVDDLGAITVRADAKDGKVDMSVSAERVETTALLEQNRADLTRDLKISAPSVADVSVRTGEGGSGSRREQHPQRQANDSWAAGTPSSMAAAASDTRVISANGKRVRIVL